MAYKEKIKETCISPNYGYFNTTPVNRSLSWPSLRSVPAVLISIIHHFKLRLVFLFPLLIILAINLKAQESISLNWPLTYNDQSVPPSILAQTGFSTGNSVDKVYFDFTNGVMATGWNSPSFNPNAYYQYLIAPEEGISLTLNRIKLEVCLSGGEMHTMAKYSTDGFRTEGQAMGQPLFFYTTTPSPLELSAHTTVTYPDTLSIRIYAWGANDRQVYFNNRNVRIQAIANIMSLPTKSDNTPLLAADSVEKPVYDEGNNGSRGIGEYFTPGTYTWVIPDGVTCIKVECWGAGGGGGGARYGHGGGGGGGAFNRATIFVNAGETYTITVGAGGLSSPGANGSDGDISEVTGPGGSVTANGGSGGLRGLFGNGYGGSGGGGIFDGGDGGRSFGNGAGGGGGAGNNGNGNDGSNTAAGLGGVGIPNIPPYAGGDGGNYITANNIDGDPGHSPAGGGGGATSTSFIHNQLGGFGGDGQVIITYIDLFDISPLNSSYCFGDIVTIGLSGSETGVTYQLNLDGSPVGSSIPGDDNPISFGDQTLAGTYTVEASLDNSSCTMLMNGTVVINDLPVVSCPADFGVCIDAAAFALTGATPTGGTYSGPGVSGGDFSPSIAGAGTHTITYTYTDSNGCTDSCSFIITVNPLPVVTCPADFGVCIDAAAFTLNGGTPAGGTYSGPGISAGVFTPSLAGVGTQNITYTYTDANGCTNYCTFNIIVNSLPNVAITPDPAVLCADGSLNLNGNPSGGSGTYVTHLWTGTGATYLSATNIVDPVFSGAAAGTYDLTYTVTDDNGCSGSDNLTITVNSLPSASITPDPAALCSDGSLNMNGNPSGGSGTYVTHLWTGTGAAYLSAPDIVNPVFSGAAAGTYDLTYTVTDDEGCSGSDNITVTVNPLPSASITPDPAVLCADGSLNLNGNPSGGSGTYVAHLWTGTGAAYLSGTDIVNPVFSGAAAGTYDLTYNVTDDEGCSGSDNITVTVNPLPSASIIPDPAVLCADGSLNLNGNPFGGSGTYITHLWTGTGAAYLSATDIVNPVFSGAAAGTYDLTYNVTDDEGCSGSDNITVTVNPLPSASITPDPAVLCADASLNLNGNPVGGSGTYITHLWTGTGAAYLSATNIVDPVFSGAAAGTYDLTYIVTDDERMYRVGCYYCNR